MNFFKSIKNRKGAIGAIGAISIGLMILALAFVVASVSFTVPVFANTHTATATLEPEWSPANEHVDYSVEFCKITGDVVNEVRIYKNYDGTIYYTNFECADKPGWEKLYINTYPACFYIADKDSPYYDPLNEDGECETFYFSAHTPAEGCDFEWKFETRDDKDYWQYEFDKTSVDDIEPMIIKTLGEPKIENSVTWITQQTPINIEVYDQGECGVSDIDYCEYRYDVDGVEVLPWTKINWDAIIGDNPPHYKFTFFYNEDSLHHLEIRCYDNAGNMAYHTQDERVDSTPPETAKRFIGPQKIKDGVEWIDGVTTVELTPVDPDPTGESCNVGVDKTWYKNVLWGSEEPCWDPTACQALAREMPYCSDPKCDGKYPKECIDRVQAYCDGWEKIYDPRCVSWCEDECDGEPPECVERCVEEECDLLYKDWYDCVQKESNLNCCGGFDWTLYTGTPIPKDQESCHVLYYFSVDSLGNLEPIKANCFFVDKTPPEIEKVVGDPNVPVRDGFDYWVTQQTPITLKCKDVGPHPSNDVTIYWKYTVDGGSEVRGSYKGEEKTIYFPEDSVHVLEFWCKDAVEKESIHDIETFKVDTVPPSITKTMIGEDHLGECPPGPTPAEPCYVRDDGENGVHIAVSDGGAICAVDQTTCSYGLWWYTDETTCEDKYGKDAWDGTKCKVDSGSFGEEGKDIIFREDSEHRLFIQCRDALNNWNSMDIETFLVDSTPPVTQKTYGDPTKVLDGYRWITKDTPITLTTKDAKVGPQVIRYRVTLLDVPDERCVEECDFTGEKDFKEYVVYSNPDSVEFKIPEDSCHLIEFYAVDKLGNAEGLHKQCVFVDNKEPELVKTVGDPSIFVRGTGCGDIIYDGEVPSGSGATVDPDHLGSLSEPIVLEPGESIEELKKITTEEIPIGKLDVLFAFDLTGSMGGVIGSAKANAISIMTAIQGLVTDAQFGVGSFMDYDGCYDFCGYEDCYGSGGDYPWSLDQDITSDTTGVSNAINGLLLGSGDDGPESYARALYESQFAGWRTGARKIVVIFEDSVPHDCNLDDYCFGYEGTGTDPGIDAIAGNSDDLTWANVVAELKAAGVSVVTVDSGYGDYCPEVWQYASDETGGLYATLGGENLPEKIVELMTEITGKIKKLTLAAKPGFEEWVEWTPEYYEDVEGLDTVDFNVKITVPEDQPGGDYHLYVKVMGDGSILAVQEIFIKVDAKPCEGGEDYWWVRDHVTPITLDCDDSWDGKAPHPVEQETMCYKMSNVDDTDPVWLTEQYCIEFKQGGSYNSETGECCAYVGDGGKYTFTFMEDSKHNLEFYCKDHLGNGGKVVDKELFKVDSVPPKTTKKYLGPYYVDGEGSEFIDTASTIELTAVDGGDICHVDGIKTYYKITMMKDDACRDSELCTPLRTIDGWTLYDKPFPIAEESCHMIEFYSEDALGNAETVNWQCVFSDHKAPETIKKYGTPFFTDGKSDWIAPSTEIHLEATDPEPHPSGVKETYYRFVLVDDKYCRDEKLCQEYDGTIDKAYDKSSPKLMFNIPEESCHLIEYYSVDNVGKVEDVNRQCVFVDKTPPEVTKVISDPKEQWAGDNTFYPGLTDRCWSTDSAKMIECWKITLGNTLKITCTDPEPHPVDHNKMCFQIELDGTDPEDDRTGKYCDYFHGQLMGGWCCIENGIENFQFLEESQHDLKVKCVDALGNEGKIDEEKFKVEGCTWELCLQKKWNLVSVPFTLFNDNPDVVFEDIKENVVSIWTYDSGVWYVWIPSSDKSTLEHVKPGYGYWVLAKEDACVEIAGSLFSPLEVPPSRDLQDGWNLIGYYGNTMMDGIPTFGVKDGRCMIPSKPVYCALNSLVDTTGGFPRWSSLYNYFNSGDDDTGWEGLNACCESGKFFTWCPSKMEAGKGYWIEMDVEDSYAPATNCIWNEDLHCVFSGMPA